MVFTEQLFSAVYNFCVGSSNVADCVWVWEDFTLGARELT